MLGNRQAFTEDLDLEVARADRTGRPASLVVVSLDPELWREQTGSDAPEAVVHVIRTELRSVDVAYRIATDEFALLLPDTRALGALVAAGRLEKRFRGVEGPAGRVTVGIAELGPGLDRHQLFRNAYRAMLAAGRDGRSRLLVYSPELEQAGAVAGPVSVGEADTVDGPVG